MDTLYCKHEKSCLPQCKVHRGKKWTSNTGCSSGTYLISSENAVKRRSFIGAPSIKFVQCRGNQEAKKKSFIRQSYQMLKIDQERSEI